MHNDKHSMFEEILERDNSMTVLKQNFRFLAIEYLKLSEVFLSLQ